MLTPPPPSRYIPPSGDVVAVIKDIPITRYTTEIMGAVHVGFHTGCRHTHGTVWKTQTAAGVAAWRWRCLTCRRYYGSPVTKAQAATITPAPPIGPSLGQMRADEETAMRESIRMNEEARSESIQNEERERVEYSQRYYRYLETPAWRVKRDRVMRRAGGICEACGVARANEVHHLTYARVFEEPLYDLVAICSPCHRRVHEIEKERRR
jgi:5-methylcytosine-specific restriction endonuclease McrA